MNSGSVSSALGTTGVCSASVCACWATRFFFGSLPLPTTQKSETDDGHENNNGEALPAAGAEGGEHYSTLEVCGDAEGSWKPVGGSS